MNTRQTPQSDGVVGPDSDLRMVIREELDRRFGDPPAHSLTGWVNTQEAMRLLGVSRPTLHRYRKKGILPYKKIGGRVYYRPSELRVSFEGPEKIEEVTA